MSQYGPAYFSFSVNFLAPNESKPPLNVAGGTSVAVSFTDVSGPDGNWKFYVQLISSTGKATALHYVDSNSPSTVFTNMAEGQYRANVVNIRSGTTWSGYITIIYTAS